MLKTFDEILKIFEKTEQNGQFIGLCIVAAMVFLLFQARTEAKRISGIAMASLVLFLFPVTYYVVVHLCGLKAAEYHTFLFVLPVLFLPPAAAVTVSRMQKNKKDSLIVLAGVCVIAFLCGGSVLLQDKYDKNTNRERVPEEIVQIFAAIDQGGGEKKVIAPDDIMLYALGCGKDYTFPYDVFVMEDKEERSVYEDELVDLYGAVLNGEKGLGKVCAKAKEYGYPYIVIAKEKATKEELEAWSPEYVFHENWAMESGGYMLLADTEHYVLYYDTTL